MSAGALDPDTIAPIVMLTDWPAHPAAEVALELIARRLTPGPVND